MAISETANKNHDELFPNHVSTLKITDPELVEFFDNFAFDEIVSYGELDTKTRLIVILASLIGSQAISEFKVMVGAALNVGVTPVEIKEVVYQSIAYLGIGKSFDFIHGTNEVFKNRGIELPLEGQSTTTPETRFEKGLAVMKEIVGAEALDKMRSNAIESQFHIQNHLAANCFGDYYTRKGLDIKTRELVTFSFLLALGAEAQFKGHVLLNKNVGNDKQLLLTVITQLLPYVGYPRTLTAIACLNEILPE